MLLYLNVVENGDKHGELFNSMYQCRYRSFMERQNYSAYVLNSIAEFDRYDMPGTYYLVWLDDAQQVRGTIRLNPMSRPTMISEVFPHLVTLESIPETDDCWEGTRICIDKDLSPELRAQIKNELVTGTIEFCASRGCKYLYGMMQNIIFRHVYEKSGVKLTYLGPTVEIGGQKCRVAKHPTNQQLLQTLQILHGIDHSLIFNIENPIPVAA